MLFNYTEDDWVFDFCNTVSTIINSDPNTNKYLRYYNTTFDLKSDEKEQIIQAADLTPQILEGQILFINDDRQCDLPEMQ